MLIIYQTKDIAFFPKNGYDKHDTHTVSAESVGKDYFPHLLIFAVERH